MDDRAYWVWLQSGLGVNAAAQELLGAFSSPRELYEAGPTQWRLSGALTNRQMRALQESSPEDALQQLRLCEKNSWDILTPEDEFYPPLLLKLQNLPLVLYVQGDPSALANQLTIAVVGTRSASYGSLQVAGRLCASLSRAGAVVVSGGALGVDAAHEGALRAGGSTAAVLGCGLGTKYLMANHALRETIAKQGALLTEFPPFRPAEPKNFPIRNRIISGMSYGTVVIEAGERSGSLITAGYALEQGRDVFAVPGDVTSTAHTGANKLIREGAKPVFSAYDILEEYDLRYPGLLRMEQAERFLSKPVGGSEADAVIDTTVVAVKKKTAVKRPKAPGIRRDFAGQESAARDAEEALQRPKEKPPLPEDFSPEAKAVWETLGAQALLADEIALQSGLAVSAVMAALTELELCGKIELCPGKRYVPA